MSQFFAMQLSCGFLCIEGCHQLGLLPRLCLSSEIPPPREQWGPSGRVPPVESLVLGEAELQTPAGKGCQGAWCLAVAHGW